MIRKKTLINDDILNEMAFDVLFHLSQPDKRDRLTATELRATKNAKLAKHYASRMSLDEKLILFAKIGIPFSFVIHPTGWKLKEWYEKYSVMTKAQQLAEASKEKLVVINDKIIANFLGLMTKTTHSDGYLLNMDFHRVGHFVNTWKDAKPDTNNLAEGSDHAKMINKLVMVTNLAMKAIKGVTDIGDLDLNILMHLYDADRYVTRKALDSYFTGTYKIAVVTAAIKRLGEKSLIEKNPTVRHPEYQLTSFGITAVLNFHSKNLQAV